MLKSRLHSLLEFENRQEIATKPIWTSQSWVWDVQAYRYWNRCQELSIMFRTHVWATTWPKNDSACMHKILVHAQNSCPCTRLLCVHKNLAHAQDSCAYTRILCMHKIIMHSQESYACTRSLCMRKIVVPAQESCAHIRILCVHKIIVHV